MQLTKPACTVDRGGARGSSLLRAAAVTAGPAPRGGAGPSSTSTSTSTNTSTSTSTCTRYCRGRRGPLAGRGGGRSKQGSPAGRGSPHLPGPSSPPAQQVHQAPGPPSAPSQLPPAQAPGRQGRAGGELGERSAKQAAGEKSSVSQFVSQLQTLFVQE